MNEHDMLRRHTRANARLVAARVKRLHDATHTLAAAIRSALDAAPDRDQAIRQLGELGFARDASGFYERTSLLARTRAGDPPDNEGVCFVAAPDERLPEVAPRIVAMVAAGAAFRAMKMRLDDVAWVYYTDRSGLGLLVPYQAPETVLAPSFDWLGYLPYQLALPVANPSRGIVWTPPNVDYGGQGVILTPSLPVYRGDVFEGACHIDVPMRSLVDDALREKLLDTQVSFLVDRAGLIVAHPTVEGVLRGEHGAVARESISTLGPGIGELDVAALFAQGSTSLEVMTPDGAAMVVAEAIPEIGWLLVSVFPMSSLQAQRADAVRGALAALSRGDTSVRVEETTDMVGEIASAFNETARALAENQRAREAAFAERRVIEGRLAEADKLRVVGRLAAGVAHDFNNLLTAIGTSVHLLRDHVDTDDSRELLATISEATDRAGALTSQLLAFSRNQHVDPRVHELSAILREALRLVQRLVSSDIELVLELADDLPLVRIDDGQLTQVLLNLVVNARDALPGRGGKIVVKAGAAERGAEIRVEDDGRGMDGETLRRAGEPFFTTKSTGTGLGLSTVKGIVAAAGGTFSMTSVLGAGTTVVVTLPAAERASAGREAVNRRAASLEAVVVLVDDDALVLNTTARGLRHLGYTVRAFSSSEDAVAVLGDITQRVSLLLTDVVMAGRNGRELAEIARRARPALPVIFMSGYTDDAILTHGIERPHDRLIRKPFSPEALAEALAAALARAG